MVTAMRSRDSGAGKGMEPENRIGIPESHQRDADQTGSLEGHKGSGSGHWATCSPAILTVEIGHGGQA